MLGSLINSNSTSKLSNNRLAICSSTKKIYTLESSTSSVECILIQNGLISLTGDRIDLKKRLDHLKINHQLSVWTQLISYVRFTKEVHWIELPDHWSVLPGLIDAHAHPLEYGETKMSVNLLGCNSTKCIVTGWDQTLFEFKQFPNADDLSQHDLLINRSIILRRVDFHAYWCSKSILNRLNLSDLDLNIDGGEIIVDQDKKPTGIFLDNAMDLIEQDEDRLLYLKTTAKRSADLETIEFYKRLDQKDQLPFRIYAMVNCGNKLIELMIRYRSAKLFIDGALGSWGAAITNGILRIEADEILTELEGTSNSNLNEVKSSNPLRLRIEHAQVLKPLDMVRMGQMNILASVQPTHAVADMDYAEARLGADRIKGAYAWKSLQKKNVTLVLGSDFPVSPVSPFLGLHAGLSRKKPIEKDGLKTDSNQTKSILILKGFTISSSFASFSESRIGTLRKGKVGDLIILDRDLIDSNRLNEDELEDLVLKVKVKGTLIEGNLVFDELKDGIKF
ncbi:amidohydrolase family-domain-containing protein [Melampsora americana]|nr:amidohydrolase family-domain-containing protein [Melampsora americana]